MEESVALTKFPTALGAGGGEMECSGDEESETEATRAMVASQNKKRKKSGGFQSMGEWGPPGVRCREHGYMMWMWLHAGFSHAVFSGIMKKGYRVPTPIQRKVQTRFSFGS